jgi:hypothetical protein
MNSLAALPGAICHRTAGGLLGLALILGGCACGPARGGDPAAAATAAAQATSTLRVAEATVQRIIAGIPTPTPLPAPSATPTPNCPGAIWWHQARAHVGEVRTVQGPVVASRPAPGALALLEVGQPYPDPTGLGVLVPAASGAAERLTGHGVCVGGPIENDEGTPMIRVRDPAAIVVVS